MTNSHYPMKRLTDGDKALEAPPCPCCSKPMDNEPANNSTSRYRDVIICAKCGVREAFERDFWQELFHKHRDAILAADRLWRRAHEFYELRSDRSGR